MAYVKWRGIQLDGTITKGYTRIRSITILEKWLHEKEIGLIKTVPVNPLSLKNRISLQELVSFFQKIALMLDAGMFLDDAIGIVCKTTHNRLFKEILEDIKTDVVDGISFADACAPFPYLFDKTIIALLQAGQQSGRLSKALLIIAQYLHQKRTIQRNVYRALLIPLCTIIFFCALISGIIVFLVPLFASVYQSVGQPLPTSTAFLLRINHFFTGYNITLLCIASGIMYGIYSLINMHRMHRQRLARFLAHIPGIGSTILQSQVALYFRSLALLLLHAVPLSIALDIMSESMRGTLLEMDALSIRNAVCAGNTLASAIEKVRWPINAEVCALLQVGHESGALALMVEKSAEVCFEKLNRTLYFFTSVLQPLLMIFLGLCVVGLVIFIYVPIFDLSYKVGS